MSNNVIETGMDVKVHYKGTLPENGEVFDSSEGKIICSENSGIRCSDAVFNAEGTKMFIGGGKSQGKIKDGKFSAWGRVLEYEVSIIEEKS